MKRGRTTTAAACLVVFVSWARLQAGAEEPVPGVVLHATHTQSSVARVDTTHTYFTPEKVLIVHSGGRTLLDLAQERVVLLAAEGGEVRSMPLAAWEAELQKAREMAPAAGDGSSSGRFEAQRQDEEIAGFPCVRYHHFGRSKLLDSEEYVEQQIWVTREIDVPEKAYAAYRRALDRIENIGRADAVQRPAGVVLAAETRTWPVGADRRFAAQVQRIAVYSVEQRSLPDSLFALPVDAAPGSGR